MLDTLKTHRTKLVHDWLVKRPRFHLHVTPTNASSRNLVECWFSLLNRRRFARSAFTSTAASEAAINADVAENNADPEPCVWTITADDVLASVAHFCQRTSHPEH